MPKSAESKLAYKASVTGGELKVVFYGLVASSWVISPERAVELLRDGNPFVFITCRNDVREKFEALWSQFHPSPDPLQTPP